MANVKIFLDNNEVYLAFNSPVRDDCYSIFTTDKMQRFIDNFYDFKKNRFILEKENNVLIVDLTLKDNKGVLREGVVFYKNDTGSNAIQDKDEIIKVLNGEYNGGLVAFQNAYINTKIRYTFIESYEIREISKDEF